MTAKHDKKEKEESDVSEFQPNGPLSTGDAFTTTAKHDKKESKMPDSSKPQPSGHQRMGDSNLLERIDKLFACGVGQYIELPQLVVVGDQSSGKSSVLAGITDLPFPRNSRLCTRFATQITFRRDSEKKLAVSILPADDADATHSAAARAWGVSNSEELTPSLFSETMRQVGCLTCDRYHGMLIPQAEQVMGIGPDKRFSKDVLKLELSGPEREHFSVVDVPGIFANTSEGKTEDKDIDFVRDMVGGFMENTQSVMLTVVPANVDPATQSIMKMAKKNDRDGSRTLGVLTKRDLVDRGAENAVMNLLQGRKHVLKLGWHVVRNPGSAEDDTPAVRHRTEATFFERKKPWSSLARETCGVSALQERMKTLLSSHIRSEFATVRSEVNKLLGACRKRLDSFGQDRGSPDEQRRYLLQLVETFQGLTSRALDTSYHAHSAFEKNKNLTLATLVRNRNESFSQMVETKGHQYEFQYVVDTVPQHDQLDEDIKKGTSRLHLVDSDIDDLLQGQADIDGPQQGSIFDWLKDLHHNSRGFELGTFPASMIPNVFMKQSEKWEGIAMAYISDIIALVHRFVYNLLEVVCTDQGVLDALKLSLYDRLVEKYKDAMRRVRYLLHVERNETPLTLNDRFTQIQTFVRKGREQEAAREEAARKKAQEEGEPIPEQPAESQAKTNTDFTIQEMHDILLSYYTVARSRFVDNVCIQAAGHCLVTGPKEVTRLRLFSSEYVIGLSDEELEEIAGVDPGARNAKERLRKEMKELEIGQRILH